MVFKNFMENEISFLVSVHEYIGKSLTHHFDPPYREIFKIRNINLQFAEKEQKQQQEYRQLQRNERIYETTLVNLGIDTNFIEYSFTKTLMLVPFVLTIFKLFLLEVRSVLSCTQIVTESNTVNTWKKIDTLQAAVAYLCPLKTSENLQAF